MLHHRDGRSAKISHNSQPMTPILNIRRRRSVFSPFDPVHTSNSTRGMFGLVQRGVLVRVRLVSLCHSPQLEQKPLERAAAVTRSPQHPPSPVPRPHLPTASGKSLELPGGSTVHLYQRPELTRRLRCRYCRRLFEDSEGPP